MKSLKVVRALGVLSAASLLSLAACGGGASATDTSATNNAANSSSSGGQTAATSETSATASTTATAPAAGLVANGDARVGDRTNCAVSGEEFVVTATSPSVVHEGKTYYMCCPGCSARFSANPQQYITAMASRTAAAAPAH